MKFVLACLFLVAAAMTASVPPSAASTAAPTAAPTKKPNALQCLICKDVVADMEKSLEEDGKKLGESEVKVICKDIVPYPSAEKYCEEYGEKEVDLIIDGLIAKESPQAVCGTISFC